MANKKTVFTGAGIKISKPTGQRVTKVSVSKVGFGNNGSPLNDDQFSYTDSGDRLEISTDNRGTFIVQYLLEDIPETAQTSAAAAGSVTNIITSGGSSSPGGSVPTVEVELNALIHVTKSGTQNLGGANGTVVYINWDGTELTKDSIFTHSTSTNPSRIEVSETGRYLLEWTIGATQGGSSRTTLMTHYRINGSTVVTRGRQRNYSRGSAYGDISAGMVTELDLTAGDYIEVATTVDDTDSAYTINTNNDECELILRRLHTYFVTAEGAITDHGLLSGLEGDDHPQYLLVTDAAATYEPKDANITKDNVAETITEKWSFDHVDGIDIGTFEVTDSVLQGFADTKSTVDSKESSWDAASAFAAVGLTDDNFDFGFGLMKRTGADAYTIISDGSSNWDTAYTHSQVTTGNPHNIGYADLGDFNTGWDARWNTKKAAIETVGGVWVFTNGIDVGAFEVTDSILSTMQTNANKLNAYSQTDVNNAMSAGSNQDAFLTDDFFAGFGGGTGILKRTGLETYAYVTDNSSEWDSAYDDTNAATNANTASTIVKRHTDGSFSAGVITVTNINF